MIAVNKRKVVRSDDRQYDGNWDGGGGGWSVEVKWDDRGQMRADRAAEVELRLSLPAGGCQALTINGKQCYIPYGREPIVSHIRQPRTRPGRSRSCKVPNRRIASHLHSIVGHWLPRL